MTRSTLGTPTDEVAPGVNVLILTRPFRVPPQHKGARRVEDWDLLHPVPLAVF